MSDEHAAELERKATKNFKLFLKMVEKFKQGKMKKKWEPWQLRPEANFFMTTNKRSENQGTKEKDV